MPRGMFSLFVMVLQKMAANNVATVDTRGELAELVKRKAEIAVRSQFCLAISIFIISVIFKYFFSSREPQNPNRLNLKTVPLQHFFPLSAYNQDCFCFIVYIS